MADVKLNTLPQSTSPTSTQDLLLFDESTNAGQRINYNTLADVILAKLTSKTYTVGGGTQTLISAIDALNSNLVSIPNPSNERLRYRTDTDCNLLIDEWALGSGSNYPPGGLFWYIHSIAYVTNTNGSIKIGKQIAYGYSVDKVIYERTCSSGVWNEWTQLPTRSEVDALNSKMVQSMARKNFSIKAVVEDKGFNCFITNGMWYQRNQVLIFVSISSNGQYLNHQMIVGNPTECPYTVSASMSGRYPVVSFEYTGDYPGGQIWYVSDLTGIGLTLS